MQQFRLAKELGLAPSANPEANLILQLRLGNFDSARDIMSVMQRMLGRGTEWLDSFIAAVEDPRLRPAAVTAMASIAISIPSAARPGTPIRVLAGFQS